MRHLFVMDPLSRINVSGDSTYMTMLEASRRDHEVGWCTPDDLYAENGVARGRITPVRTVGDAPWFITGDPEEEPLGAYDVVWMRKDPPFDMNYILTTYLLDMIPRRTIVINDPLGLKRFNEKLFAMQFAEFHPPVLLSKDKRRITAFVKSVGRAVLKPWDGNGGRGVVITDGEDRNLPSLIELLTADGRDYCLAQRYIDGIVRGDKRILLFEGEPVAGVLRVPSDRDHRGNIHVGARVEACELTARDRAICAALGPVLREHGLPFVGIDVIDGWLTEINVTSPTGIQEANRLYGRAFERDLMDVAMRQLAVRRQESP